MMKTYFYSKMRYQQSQTCNKYRCSRTYDDDDDDVQIYSKHLTKNGYRIQSHLFKLVKEASQSVYS